MKIKGYLIFLFITLISCQNFDYQSKGKDVPTQGNIYVGFDIDDSLLVQQWLDMFKHDYPKSNIIPVFSSATNLINLLKKDSLSGAILNHQFENAKLNWLLDKRNVSNRTVILGYTSIAFIVNKENPISQLDYKDLMLILSKQSEKKLRIIADFKGSCIMQLKDSLQKYSSKPLIINTAFDVQCNSPQEIVNRIQQDKQALGILPLNFISDKKDNLAIANRKNVKVLKIENPFYSDFYYPFQSQIAAKQYPFTLPIVAYDLQGYSGLMSGLVLYANSQPGQIIVKKSGLYPSNPPSRTIQIITE